MFNNLFGKKPTVAEQQRENDRSLRKATRDIEKEKRILEMEEKKLELEIKKNAKAGNNDACKILAKQLIEIRKQKVRTYAATSKITSVGFQNKTIGSNIALTNALSTTSKTMASINNIIRPEGVAKDMQEFQKANMKMDMTQEMIDDTLDDMLTESGDEEESNTIINKVLDEIGIEISGKLADVPAAGSSTLADTTRSDQDIESRLAKLKPS